MMKYLLLLLAVSAGVQGSPVAGAKQSRALLDDLISAAVEEISSLIVEAGFDPFNLDSFEAGYALPVPVLFNTQVSVKELEVTGVSNIVINNINFNLFSLKLTLDISLPKIAIFVGESAFDLTFFGSKLNADLAGSVTITEPRVAGTVNVKVGGLSGFTVKTIDLELSLGGLFSLLDVNVQGKNVSPQVNNFISNTIPNTLTEHKSDINELLNIVLKSILDDML